jgi:delta24-sterol reductase
MKYSHQKFDIYPIWLCPHKCVTTEPQGMLSGSEEMYVDVGLYGPMMESFRQPNFDHVEALRDLEGYMRKINGFQALYATTEMTRTEWAQMFDQKLYNLNRKKYGAEGVFMDAYEKVKRPNK